VAEDTDTDPRPPAGAASSQRARRLVGAFADRFAPYVPALIGSCVVGYLAMHGILERTGEPAAPLDDSFIHLQYARRLAEGHFFSYVPGEGYTSGATSPLWPLLLAPFHALGLRGVSLLDAAWAFGTLAHAAVAVETYRLAERLAGRAAALGAALMCVVFGAFAWFAWSGMETVPFAWALMRAARMSADFCEPAKAPSPSRSRRRPTEAGLLAMAMIGPLLRPEGIIASVVVAIALAVRPRNGSRARRLLALVALAGPLIVPLIHSAFTGHASSSTTSVKWLVANPYYLGATLRGTILANVRLLFSSLLDGGEWTAVFLPEHFAIPIFLGVFALPLAAYRRKAPYHALFVAAVALGTLIPCSYLSFLWNRVRYIWPFAGAWFVLIACFAREFGDLVRLARPRLTFVPALVTGLVAGALAMKLSWALSDLAQSSHAIQRQQVALGRWASEHLPEDARIGVNDTGAIAYLGGRRTFDVVGLTTEGEARYWVAGAGSRFEHYEKLAKERLPTHFIVYPQWMACAPVLGKQLFEATVTDQSILGGNTMVVYEARWDTLGTGALPAAPPEGMALVDELDVADLESEATHGYDLAGTFDQDNQVTEIGKETDWAGAIQRSGVADGGRVHRRYDSFTAHLPAGKAARLVMRVGADDAVTLTVSAGDHALGTIEIPSGPWVERTIEIPASAATTSTPLTVVVHGEDDPRFHSFHYWFYGASP
jgi:hypothetical protein